MSVRLPSTAAERALVRRWVVATTSGKPSRYLRLRSVAPLRDRPDRDMFEADLARDARDITDGDLRCLLELDWRPRLTAAWLIGLDRRTQFRGELGELLLADEVGSAGWGYCLALARFGEPADVDILVSYLNDDRSRTRPRYSHAPALEALLALDARVGTHHASRFIAREPHSPYVGNAAVEPLASALPIAQLCAFAERIMATHR